MNSKAFLARLAVLGAGTAALAVAAPAGATADVSAAATAKAHAVVAMHDDTTMAPMGKFGRVCTPTECWSQYL
jgi:hypothetical protein